MDVNEKFVSTVNHPLEPLTEEEINIAVHTLRSEKSLSENSRFVTVVLKEPEKSFVRNYVS